MKTGNADLGALRIAYDEAGEGGRPLVLLHGLTGHRRDFEGVLPDLARYGRTLAPDLRGHGDSTPTGGGYDFPSCVDDQLRFLDAMGIEHCDLLGHSFGGMLALRFTLAHPERVSSLVLMSTSCEAPDNLHREVFVKAGGYARQHGMEALQARLEEIGLAKEPPLADTTSDSHRDWRERYWPHHRLRHLAMDSEAYEALGIEMMDQQPVTERLSEIRCPCLVIIGSEDADFVRGAGVLSGGLPDVTVCWLEGVDHHPHQEDRPGFLESMSAHLSRVRPGPR
jgi:pimeloyl-ACP methyl ester carboxylesterase